MTADLLAGGSESRRRRPVLCALAVVLVLLAVAGYAAVRADRDRQVDALVAAAVRAERVITDAGTSLSGLVAYSNAALSRPDLEPAARTAVLQSFARDAARFRPRVQAPREDVSRVRAPAWDAGLREARSLVLARIDAWTASVGAAATHPDELLTVRRDTRGLRDRTADALLRAASGRGGPELDRLVAALRAR